MSRFPFASLDLSLLPAPQAIHPIDYEAIRAARIASLAARFTAAGIAFDVTALETDPSIIHQEEDAYREMLDLQAINDAVDAVLIAYAIGNDLDNLGALLGLRRITITPADAANNISAVMESDTDFRARLRVCLDATAVGLTGGGYKTIALQASAAVKAVALIKHGGGQIDVILQGRGTDGSVADADVQKVRDALTSDEGGQLTDIVTVRSATPLPYTIVANAIIPLGPSPAAVKAASEAALASVASTLMVIGGTIPTDALIAAGRVAPITKFTLVSPAADLVPAADQVPYAKSITVNVTVAS